MIRAYAGPLAAALGPGSGPGHAAERLAHGRRWTREPESEFPGWYLYLMLILVLWEAPLVTAAADVVPGASAFSEKIETRKIARNLAASLPQLTIYQVLVRGMLLAPPVLLWFLPFVTWPYLNEVILLERNRLSPGRSRRMTTNRRMTALHAGSGGDLFVQWVLAMVVGIPLAISLWGSLCLLADLMLDRWQIDTLVYTLYYPLALWITLGFFAVVRFLGYLDLRIRREGWEVELMMRAEGARLERQLV